MIQQYREMLNGSNRALLAVTLLFCMPDSLA